VTSFIDNLVDAKLTIPEAAWMECGEREPWHALLACVQINETMFHAEAWAVDPEYENEQVVLEREASLDAAYAICGDGPLETTTIRGREYVLTLVPFAD
jgi:hypothetical protein